MVHPQCHIDDGLICKRKKFFLQIRPLKFYDFVFKVLGGAYCLDQQYSRPTESHNRLVYVCLLHGCRHLAWKGEPANVCYMGAEQVEADSPRAYYLKDNKSEFHHRYTLRLFGCKISKSHVAPENHTIF